MVHDTYSIIRYICYNNVTELCKYIFIPPVYEVYRGYIVFAFSVRMFVCVSVNFFFRQRFLRNYLT